MGDGIAMHGNLAVEFDQSIVLRDYSLIGRGDPGRQIRAEPGHARVGHGLAAIVGIVFQMLALQAIARLTGGVHVGGGEVIQIEIRDVVYRRLSPRFVDFSHVQ